MPKILIIKPSSLGDIVHGLQVAQTVRAHWPEARIDWVARDVFAPLVEACEAVDHVFLFRRSGGAAAFSRLVAEVREVRYDWVLDMQGLARSGLLTLMARGARKVGRSDAREGAGMAYGSRVPLPQVGRSAHALDILLEFLPVLGLPPGLRGPVTFKPRSCEHLPKALLDGRAILLFPNSRRPEKEWNGFYGLTQRLLVELPGLPVAWVGQSGPEPDDAWRGRPFFNLLGQTSLTDLVELIRGARLVVCNDSGPMHIAAAVGTELVALFGPTPPERFGPYPLSNPRHHVLRAPVEGLQALPVDAVAAAVVGAVAAPVP